MPCMLTITEKHPITPTIFQHTNKPCKHYKLDLQAGSVEV